MIKTCYGYEVEGGMITLYYLITEKSDRREVTVSLMNKNVLIERKWGDLVYSSLRSQKSMISLLNRLTSIDDFYNMEFYNFPHIVIKSKLILGNG